MEKWNLFVVRGEEADKKTLTRAKTFAEAEKIAKELFKEYDDGMYSDFMVFCTPHYVYNNSYMDFHPEEDFPIMRKDVDNTFFWMRMRVDEFCMLDSVFDDDFIDEIREDDERNKSRHIYELSEEELERLYKQISFGSMYVSDYMNDLNVDEKEVCDYAEGYSDELYEEYGNDWEEHLNAEGFAEYCAA